MTNREKCISILDSLSEEQLGNIALMLQAAKDDFTDARDDAYCKSLYAKYEADPDKGQPVSLEDAAKLMGISLRMSLGRSVSRRVAREWYSKAIILFK